METISKEGIGIKGAFGAVGILLFAMIVCSPILLLHNIVDEELETMLFYIASVGGAFFIMRAVFGFSGNQFKSDNIKTVLLVIMATFAIQIGISTPISDMIPMPNFMKEIFIKFASQTSIFSFITIVIAAPIFEELIFRGIVLRGLLNRYAPMKAILISSILFGLIHLNPWQFIGATIIGLFMGWVYYKTGNLLLTIAIHFANNFVGFILLLFFDPRTMMEMPLADQYGGTTYFILIIIAALTIGALCLFMLKNEFAKRDGTPIVQQLN